MRGLTPSVISADMARFGECLRLVEPHAVRWHVDVMDGHYVPNLTIGPAFCETIARCSTLPQDVHLMVTNPGATWEWYAKAGASRIAFHPDTDERPQELLERIAAAGLGAGLAVNPDVDPEAVLPYLGAADHIIVMSVYPGFSGQRFIPEAVPKITRLRKLAEDAGTSVEIIVDGGVNEATAPGCVEAGADLLVSASAVFGSEDPARVAAELARMVE